MLIIVITVCVIFIIIAALLSCTIRLRYTETKVTCWFCHVKCSVEKRNINSWDCPGCLQYNGFNKDGGYNKVIPAHRDKSLNQSNYQYPNSKTQVNAQLTAWSLCECCQMNETLKLQLLTKYEPMSDDTFDDEIHRYRRMLEIKYPLCVCCEDLVGQKMRVDNRIISPMYSLPMKALTSLKKSLSSRISTQSRSLHIESPKKHRNSRKPFLRASQLKLVVKFIFFVNFLISLLLWVSNLHNLQRDSGLELLPIRRILPAHYIDILSASNAYAHFVVAIAIFVMTYNWAIFIRTLRRCVCYSDIFCLLLWSLLLIIHLPCIVSSQMVDKEDVFMLQMIFSTALCPFTLLTIISNRKIDPAVIARKKAAKKYSRTKPTTTTNLFGSPFSSTSSNSYLYDSSLNSILSPSSPTIFNSSEKSPSTNNTSPQLFQIDQASVGVRNMSLGGSRKRSTFAQYSAADSMLSCSRSRSPKSDHFSVSTTEFGSTYSTLFRPPQFNYNTAIANSIITAPSVFGGVYMNNNDDNQSVITNFTSISQRENQAYRRIPDQHHIGRPPSPPSIIQNKSKLKGKYFYFYTLILTLTIIGFGLIVVAMCFISSIVVNILFYFDSFNH